MRFEPVDLNALAEHPVKIGDGHHADRIGAAGMRHDADRARLMRRVDHALERQIGGEIAAQLHHALGRVLQPFVVPFLDPSREDMKGSQGTLGANLLQRWQRPARSDDPVAGIFGARPQQGRDVV